MWGHCFTKQIFTSVINQSNNVINLLSKAAAIWYFEEGVNSIEFKTDMVPIGYWESIENTNYYSFMEDQA